MTPLHMSTSYGYLAISNNLMENGARLYALDQEQSTPLHLAAAAGHVKICQRLLEEAKKQGPATLKQVRFRL